MDRPNALDEFDDYEDTWSESDFDCVYNWGSEHLP